MNIDRVFEALSSTQRRKILAYLSETPLTAGEIAERFEMTKPSLSKHLKILETAGLVVSTKKGQFVHYQLADENMLTTLHSYLTTFCPVGGPLKRESAELARTKKTTEKDSETKE